MRPEAQRQRLLSRRAALLGAGQVILLGALAGRMYELQILESDRYTMLADENRINLRLLPPPRGRILDRFGVPLADNHQNYRLVIVAEQAGDIAATLDALASLIEIGETDRRRVMREVRRKHPFVPIVVRANLGWEDMARVEVAMPELPGVAIEQGLTRSYSLGSSAAHVIGYVAAVAETELTGDPLLELPDFRIGKNGVEKAQDGELRGGAGTSQVEVNAFGRIVRELGRVPGRPGKDVVIGLDATIHCWRKGGHGTIRLRDAIKKSCDVFFYETARRLGIDRLAAMARRFGFGSVLGLDIPGERPGLIPSREWKLATAGAAWSQGETLIAGIGQGSVLATPLQIAVMIARLVTGRAVVPRLIRAEGMLSPDGEPVRDDFSPLGVSPRVLALVLDGMNA